MIKIYFYSLQSPNHNFHIFPKKIYIYINFFFLSYKKKKKKDLIHMYFPIYFSLNKYFNMAID